MTQPIRIRLSPSRVELFLTCPARWAFSELDGFREPDTEATEFGTAVHLEHELYFGPANRPYDTSTPHGQLAWEMSSKYPSREDFASWGGKVEAELTHTVDGYTLEGRLDMLWLPPDGVPVVGDHKTTGSLRWAKLERSDLFGHAQAPFYLLVACEKYGTDRARSHWVYATTKNKPAVLRVSAHEITKEEARDRTYTRMLPVVRQMVAARDAGMHGNDLPKNHLACKKYNRWCPHIARCQPERHNMSSFLASLDAAEKAAQPTPPAVPPTPPAPSGGLFTNPADPTAGRTNIVITPPTVTIADAVEAAIVEHITAVAADAAAAVNPPEGAGKGKGKGRKTAGEKGGSSLDEATLDALADRVVDKLATRLMGGVR